MTYRPTTTVLTEVDEGTWNQAIAFLRCNPDWDCHRLVDAALEHFFDLYDDGPTVEIPAALLTDLVQVCIWARMMGDQLPVSYLTYADVADQARSVEAWAKEFCMAIDSASSDGFASDCGGEP